MPSIPFSAPLVFIVTCALALGVGCGGGAAPTAAPSTSPPSASAATAGSRSDIGVAELKALVDAGAISLLVDVRTPREYASGHVQGAVNVPLDALGGRLAELGAPGEQTVHLICQSGGRSSRAADQLVGDGYSVVNVAGGTGGWIAAGHAVSQ